MTSRTNFSGTTILDDPIPERCERPTKVLSDGTEIELPAMWMYCSNLTTCGRRKRIEPSCGRRNCRRCQAKRAVKLARRFMPPIMSKKNERGAMWSFVNLTGVHIALSKSALGPTLRLFGDTMERFVSEEYDKGGLCVVEHTTTTKVVCLGEVGSEGNFYGMDFAGPCSLVSYEQSLYVHGHAICYGGFKNKAKFEERWGAALVQAGLLTQQEYVGERENAVAQHPGAGYESVVGLRYVGLEAVRNVRSSVRYILKYVAKGVELPEEYLEGLKRLKYVRAWGSLYRMKEPSYDLFCSNCGGNVYFTVGGEELLAYACDPGGPLIVERVPRLS